MNVTTLIAAKSMPKPSFKNPPVVERVLTVQFQELPEFDTVHFGLWYDRIKDEFPEVTRQPPLTRIIEEFPYRGRSRHVEFGVAALPPLPRCVFRSSSEVATQVHQLQADRFSTNWHRRPDGMYAEFPQVCSEFRSLFERFVRFWGDLGFPSPVADLCEVAYINRIDLPDGESIATVANRVFPGLDLSLASDWLPEPRAFTLNRVYDFESDRGRLYVEASVGHDRASEFILLKLTGRTTVDSASCWPDRLELAHRWVVDGFVSVTGEGIRKEIWEQIS